MNTQNRLIQMVVAIFAAAFIGGLIATNTFEKSWIAFSLGVTAGGVLGYFFYDPKQVLSVTVGVIKTLLATEREVAVAWLKSQMQVTSNGLRCMSLMTIWLLGVVSVLLCHAAEPLAKMYENDFIGLCLLLPTAVGWMVLVMMLFNFKSINKSSWSGALMYLGAILVGTTPLLFPAMILLISVVVCGALYFVIKGIHSEMRVQTACYSAIGAGLGWYLDSALIGAALGALLGVAVYKFVSEPISKGFKKI